MFGDVGKKTVEELHQDVMAWLDQAGRVIQDLLDSNEVEITIRTKPKEKP